MVKASLYFVYILLELNSSDDLMTMMLGFCKYSLDASAIPQSDINVINSRKQGFCIQNYFSQILFITLLFTIQYLNKY